VQVKRFLEQCSPRWRLFFTVALDSGLRRGELIGLRWSDVDLLQRIIYVRRSIGSYDDPDELSGDEERLSTKTEASRRLVPILDGAQAALEELYAASMDTEEHSPVFATVESKRSRDGAMRPTGRPLDPRMLTRVFRRYAERAGLPQSIRLHDLRHTAITNAIGQGEDILLVSAFAGHAKTSTTVDVYGHLMPERVREAARRMHSVSGAGGTVESSVSAALSSERSASSARGVDSRSLPGASPLGPGATVTMRLRRGAAPAERAIELGRSDGGRRVMSVERNPPMERAPARLLAAWDAHAEARAAREVAARREQASGEPPTPHGL
jgi:site-specific recombinase XerC